jgi:hypothetical protein
MITINTISPTRFSFNGVTYHKNFMPFVTGNKIAIINVYDGCITLTDAPTIFSDYTVNGVTYSSVNDLQSALLDVIYTRNSLTNAAITLTTTGNSGAATLTGITLNIPNYTLSGLGGVGGTGTTNFLPKFTGGSTLGNSLIFDNGTNVGIGTTSPIERLHVVGNSFFKVATNRNLYISSNTDSVGLFSINDALNENTSLVMQGSDFRINTFGANERMRITSAGNVGIGTTSPTTRLTVQGGYANFTDGSVNIYAGSDGDGGLFGTITNHYQRFITNNVERMRITSGGDVGIGTTSPSGQLHLKGASGLTNFGTQMLQVESSTDNFSGIVFSGTSGSNAAIRSEGASTMTFWTASGTSYTERMRITSTGNVGIGTTSPTSSNWSRTLQLEGASAGFKVASSSANGEFWAAGDVGINVNTSGKNLYLGNASSLTAFTLASSGNVGINTTNPAQRLDVNGLINSTNGICVGGEGVSRFWTGTQAAYDAITTKVSTTVYLIT